jgi:hypothetical protein
MSPTECEKSAIAVSYWPATAYGSVASAPSVPTGRSPAEFLKNNCPFMNRRTGNAV